MAIYTIIRVYEVPAERVQQATDRMIEAIVLHVERDFHVKDIIREPGAKPGKGKQVDLRPAAGWLELALKSSWVCGKGEPKEVACLPTVHQMAIWWTEAGKVFA